jgi:hypothetical protein
MDGSWFGKFLNKVGREYGQADKNIFGGLLPGGAASPLSPIKQAVGNTVKETALSTAGSAMNALPDRANLFARYMTGVGNRNLQLDSSTLIDLRNATEQNPMAMSTVTLKPFSAAQIEQVKNSPDRPGKAEFLKLMQAPINPKPFTVPMPAYGPGLPQTGPVYPYGTAPKSVTNTLGRFNATVDPSANTVQINDTYDMVNSAEDPNLVAGKIQPQRAWNAIESIWNPAAAMRNSPGPNFPLPKSSGYNPTNAMATANANTKNPTYSPLTQVARAAMYMTPWKPTPYEVNLTVPYRGEI